MSSKFSRILEQFNDLTALSLLAIIAFELAVISSQLSQLVSRL